MTDALNYLYIIFDNMTEFVFDDMVIFTGVTFGWVVVSVVLFSMLIKNILNLPRGMSSFDKFRGHKWGVTTYDNFDRPVKSGYVAKRRLK